jgi:hypothetical protein
LFAADTPGPRGTAASRQIGQAIQRGARTAEMIDQRAEGARPRYYGANATTSLETTRSCDPEPKGRVAADQPKFKVDFLL